MPRTLAIFFLVCWCAFGADPRPEAIDLAARDFRDWVRNIAPDVHKRPSAYEYWMQRYLARPDSALVRQNLTYDEYRLFRQRLNEVAGIRLGFPPQGKLEYDYRVLVAKVRSGGFRSQGPELA